MQDETNSDLTTVTFGGKSLPVVGTLDLSTGKVSLNPLGMVLLLSKPKAKRTKAPDQASGKAATK